MKSLLVILGALLLLAGLLFAGQGAGIIPWPQTSFMINAGEWVLYGLVLAVAGLVLLGLGLRARKR